MSETKCKKCNKEMTPTNLSHYYSEDTCEECRDKEEKIREEKKRKLKNIFIIGGLFLVIVGAIIGGFLGSVDYNYQIDKCNNLDSSEYAYDFDHKVEINVNYGERCYYKMNHPFAKFEGIFTGVVVGILMAILIGLLILLCLMLTIGSSHYY